MTKLRIKVTYKDPLDVDLDDEIRKQLESLGADWYAQGTDLVTGVRDLAFDWDITLTSPDVGHASKLAAKYVDRILEEPYG